MGGVKFAVCTDLHHDIAPGGHERLMRFVERARAEDVDFIIELGDFCAPGDENKALLTLFNGFEKPYYHVIGNHDTDAYAKKELMQWLHMDAAHYSFVQGNVKFIVLDTSFIQYGDEFESYYRRNYKKTEGIYPAIPHDQLQWLERELMNSPLPVVIFSHHSLENGFKKRGVLNRAKVHEIIRRAEAKGKRVLLCLNGHDHADSLDKVDNTHYFTLNSMTYKWFGAEYEHFCYAQEVHAQYPYLKDIVLYKDALSAVVSVDEKWNVTVTGMESGYEGVMLEQIGLKENTWDGRVISPRVSSFRLGF